MSEADQAATLHRWPVKKKRNGSRETYKREAQDNWLAKYRCSRATYKRGGRHGTVVKKHIREEAITI